MMGDREKSLHEMTEVELREVMDDVASTVEALLPPDTGFIVLACPFGQGSMARYVTNANRHECVGWLRDASDVFAGKGEVGR
jgi:hypothetical protein